MSNKFEGYIQRVQISTVGIIDNNAVELLEEALIKAHHCQDWELPYLSTFDSTSGFHTLKQEPEPLRCPRATSSGDRRDEWRAAWGRLVTVTSDEDGLTHAFGVTVASLLFPQCLHQHFTYSCLNNRFGGVRTVCIQDCAVFVDYMYMYILELLVP